MLIATGFAVAIIGQSCSKEKTNDSTLNQPQAKSLPATMSGVNELVDDFSTELYNYATSEPYTIEDLKVDYAIDLMEATFNYQHAVVAEDFDDQVTSGLFGIERVSYTMEFDYYTDAEGDNRISGANVASVFMDMFSTMQESLGEDEYYFNSDFKFMETVGGLVKVSVNALKATPTFPTSPVTTSHRIYDSGVCGGANRAPAWKRLVPTIFREARTITGLYGVVFYNYNVEDVTVGYTSYIGPNSGNSYCKAIVGSSWRLVVGEVCLNKETTDRCMSAAEMEGNVDGHKAIIAGEIPAGKEFTGVYVGYMDGPNSWSPSYSHYHWSTYGQFGNINLNDFNNRSNNLTTL